jgi:hypothetical protein
VTCNAVGVGASVTEGGIGMGCLPTFDVKPPRAGADELKQRATVWRSAGGGRVSMSGSSGAKCRQVRRKQVKPGGLARDFLQLAVTRPFFDHDEIID